MVERNKPVDQLSKFIRRSFGHCVTAVNLLPSCVKHYPWYRKHNNHCILVKQTLQLVQLLEMIKARSQAIAEGALSRIGT